MPDFDNGKTPDTTNRAWDWLFGVFYGVEPVFDDNSLPAVLSSVVALAECADVIGSIKSVRHVAEVALMRQDQVLWTSIAGNPQAWTELSCRIQSCSVWKEAAIHLVGQWGTTSDEQKSKVLPHIRAIIERKVDELSVRKEAVELRILGHYPEFMRRAATDKPGRPTYGNDIYMWMAVGFFRQWFAQSISDDRTRRAPDGGFNFYSALHEGGQAYLTHIDFVEFHKYFPMSLKACQLLEANMGVLKDDIKRFVDDLMHQESHLKRDEHDISWLTCTKLEKEDYPWDRTDSPKRSNFQPLLTAAADDDDDDAADNGRTGIDARVDDNAMIQALAQASAAHAGRKRTKPASELSGGSARGRNKRARRNERGGDDSGSEYYPESSTTSGGMFVPEDGDDKDE